MKNIFVVVLLFILFDKKYNLLHAFQVFNFTKTQLIILLCFFIYILLYMLSRYQFYKKFNLSEKYIIKKYGQPIKKIKLWLKYTANKSVFLTERNCMQQLYIYDNIKFLVFENRAKLIEFSKIENCELPVNTSIALNINNEIYYYKLISPNENIKNYFIN